MIPKKRRLQSATTVSSSPSASSSDPSPRSPLPANMAPVPPPLDPAAGRVSGNDFVRLSANRVWPMDERLRMPDGTLAKDNILADQLQDPSYVSLLRLAAAGRWAELRARFGPDRWAEADVAGQMALWGGEMQRLAMIPAFQIGGQNYYSSDLQLWLARRGMILDRQLGAGSFGTAFLTCPSVRPGACKMVIKIQKVLPGRNSADEINQEYSILRFVNAKLPGLAPALRSDLEGLQDAITLEAPDDRHQFLYFAMDQWSGNLQSLEYGPPAAKAMLDMPMNVLATFLGEVTALFQTNVMGTALKVRQHGTGKELDYITNLDGLTMRNVLYIEQNGVIARLGIADWGWISDPADPRDGLTDWTDFVRTQPKAFFDKIQARAIFGDPPLSRGDILAFLSAGFPGGKVQTRGFLPALATGPAESGSSLPRPLGLGLRAGMQPSLAASQQP